MSDLLDELVFPVAPVSTTGIERVANDVLDIIAPDMLVHPHALDCMSLIDEVLPKHGIDVYPARVEEIGARLGVTKPGDDGRTVILLSEGTWEDLIVGGRQANRARATFAHELGHAVLHVRIMRQLLATKPDIAALNRVARRRLRAFEDPEWQAWTLGGCLLAPRRMIERLRPVNAPMVAGTFTISVDLARSHMRRLRMGG